MWTQENILHLQKNSVKAETAEKCQSQYEKMDIPQTFFNQVATQWRPLKVNHRVFIFETCFTHHLSNFLLYCFLLFLCLQRLWSSTLVKIHEYYTLRNHKNTSPLIDTAESKCRLQHFRVLTNWWWYDHIVSVFSCWYLPDYQMLCCEKSTGLQTMHRQ